MLRRCETSRCEGRQHRKRERGIPCLGTGLKVGRRFAKRVSPGADDSSAAISTRSTGDSEIGRWLAWFFSRTRSSGWTLRESDFSQLGFPVLYPEGSSEAQCRRLRRQSRQTRCRNPRGHGESYLSVTMRTCRSTRKWGRHELTACASQMAAACGVWRSS